ncbi:MAG: hypothetical protein KGI90_04685 [Burkholderiales bacterium]|nr:hypothetical protein [Burkholderiales bacterium]MDE2275563.1 hypothetical protein [Burkholderiales bacterium]
MYDLISRLPARQLLLRQAPTLVGALAIAEMFYKWHSFLLETGGFLLTWFVLDALVSVIERAFARGARTGPPR